MENALPVVCELVRVTLPFCVLVNTTGTVAVAPTATFPNNTFAGLAVTVWLVTPEPATATLRDVLEASLTNVTCPLTPPVTVGVNATPSSRLAPAAKVRGSFNVEILIEVWFALTFEIVTLDEPLLVTAMRRVSV
jgi:hypothetical protein